VCTAIILSGGLGTRLRSVVPELPKPLAPIANRPFLEYLLDYWIEQGVDHFILSVGYRHEMLINHFGSSYRGIELSFVIEETPLGTGGGLLLALQKHNIRSPFLLLNGDTFFAVELKALIEFFHKNNTDWLFSLFRTDEEKRYMGIEVTQSGEITKLNSGKNNHRRVANGGVYLVNPRALIEIKKTQGDKVSLEDDIFPTALDSGQRLFGMEFNGAFIDIGTPDDYQRAFEVLTEYLPNK